HLGGLADAVGPTDQPMRVKRIGLTADLVDGIIEALRRGRGADTLRDALITFRGAELGGEVLLPRNALTRNPVVEKIGPVVDFDRDVGIERNRPFEPPLADEAPRADHIGNDVDTNRLLVGHGENSLWREPRLPTIRLQPYGCLRPASSTCRGCRRP